MDRLDILAGLGKSIALGGPLKKTRGTPVMPGCLSARLRPDEEGLPLPTTVTCTSAVGVLVPANSS